ncbi:MAG TPA: hypothetical protein VMT22_01760 [Terriglobales bacterium]|nr:hypothetical protein [Terriglobales bacterium]
MQIKLPASAISSRKSTQGAAAAAARANSERCALTTESKYPTLIANSSATDDLISGKPHSRAIIRARNVLPVLVLATPETV